MTGHQRLAVRAGIVVGSLLLVLMIVLLVLTQTDWGREHVRRVVVARLDQALDGQVEVGRLEGNLLRRWRLVEVSIADPEGRPFVTADTIATRFSIRGLLGRRIVLRDLRLVEAEVVLNQPPGERWNYVRILPEPEPDPDRLGWGDWIRLERVTILDSRLTIRSEWRPDPTLPPAERERKVTEALDGDGRANIQRVPGGFQNIMDFRGIHARLDRVLLADPDVERTELEVAALRAIAQPYRPPVADVRNLAGTFFISGDSVWFRDVRARLPGSRMVATGAYHLATADLVLRMAGNPAAFPDLRWLHPPLPEEGGGRLRMAIHRRQAATRILAEDMDVRVRDGVLQGDLRLVVGDTFRILPTDLRFARLDSRPVARLIPGFEPPAHGTLDGRLALSGNPVALQVDGDITLTHAPTGRSRVVADGRVSVAEEVRFADLRLEARPLRTDLVRARLPQLPPGATITGQATLNGALGGPLRLRGDVTLADPATGRSRVMAGGTIDPVPGGLRFSSFDLDFRPLRAELVRGEAPRLPAGSTITGRLRLDGSTTAVLEVQGDLSIIDPATGVSRVAGGGALDLTRELTFRGMDLRLDPLQVPLLRRLEPDLPLGGTLTGTARLDGRPGARLAIRGDLVHVEAGERSRVAGRGEVVPGAWARVDVQLLPLSLVTAGRFVPEADLRGGVRGRLQAMGDLGDLGLRAELAVVGGGEIVAEGHLDLESQRPGYDLATRVRAFDLAAVTGLAPAVTDLTGVIDARGRGLEPATMQAELRADLVGSAVDGVGADEVRLRLAISEGLARVDSSVARVGSTVAWADGEFGLVGWRDGELRYQIRLDTLQTLAAILPPGEADVVIPRAAVRHEALAEARVAARRAERRRLVELIATGRAPPAEPLPVDTLLLVGIPRDTLAGRLESEGVLRGNVETFDLVGAVEVEELVVHGNYVGAGQAEFAWIQRGAPTPFLELDAVAERLLIEGFALDSARANVHHRGGPREGVGRAVLAAWQDEDTDYRADVEFTMALDRGEALLHDLDIRLDTIAWRSTGPSAVRWDDRGVEVEDLELVSHQGGLILVAGRLPVEGEADLSVLMREVELAHLALLLQDDADVSGRVTLEADMTGTLRAPAFEGVGILADGSRNGQQVPDIRATFAYRAAELTVAAELFEEEGRAFAVVDAALPIDLALADRTGPRLLEAPLAVEIRADSLPLEGLAAISDQIRDADGVAAGELVIGGTWTAPTMAGELTVDRGELRLPGTGVRYHDVVGRLRFTGSELVVDSLVAEAGGPIRVTGVVDLSRLDRPGFDLEVTARNAWAMRTGDVRVRLDADLEVTGPFEDVTVTGRARSRRSVIYIPETREKALVSLDRPDLLEELEGRLLEVVEELIDRPSPLLANLEVDVELHIEPDTWIRSTDYNVEIYTPPDLGPLRVRLDQAAGRLTLEGTVNSDRGHYSFMGRRFDVTRGAATFLGAPEPDPLLQVAAEHEVQMPGREDFSIRVIIGGTALNPTLTVETDARPPIAETEVFAYIALGRSAGALLQQQGSALTGQGTPTGDLIGNVAGLATMQMGALAANTLLDELESEMARELGVDILHIVPADLPAELFSGRFGDLLRGTEIELGRYIGPRLFAAVRARPTTETRPGALLEYSTPAGYRWTTSLEPRFLPREPTLREVDLRPTSVFGAFMFRDWRF
jgi:hypothetical protein